MMIERDRDGKKGKTENRHTSVIEKRPKKEIFYFCTKQQWFIHYIIYVFNTSTPSNKSDRRKNFTHSFQQTMVAKKNNTEKWIQLLVVQITLFALTSKIYSNFVHINISLDIYIKRNCLSI